MKTKNKLHIAALGIILLSLFAFFITNIDYPSQPKADPALGISIDDSDNSESSLMAIQAVIDILEEKDVLKNDSKTSFIFDGMKEIDGISYYQVTEYYDNGNETITRINSYAISSDLCDVYFVYDPTIQKLSEEHFIYNLISDSDENDGRTILINLSAL